MCFRDLLEPAFNSRDVKQVRQLASREALQGWSGCGSWSGTAAGRWQYTMVRFLNDEPAPELGIGGESQGSRDAGLNKGRTSLLPGSLSLGWRTGWRAERPAATNGEPFSGELAPGRSTKLFCLWGWRLTGGNWMANALTTCQPDLVPARVWPFQFPVIRRSRRFWVQRRACRPI